ncbi:unnamed protein product [Ceutorhynchus assimilis]|uniref:Uncharacterized protein n=1 Tax=Ceutorhynchus assimilis TaxID=467358 RepID=A0A9N9MXV0_9CUCU|nr:unnamed protein product [Ceutorhynchus assimilis]
MHKNRPVPLIKVSFKMYCLKLVLVTTIYLETLTWLTPLCTAYQYFVLGKNGDYKYGYRTDDAVVRQEADQRNQVSGHYFYRDDLGNFGLKYTSGVQGYSPQQFGPNDDADNPYPQGVSEDRHTSTYVNPNLQPPNRPQSQPRKPFPFANIWNYQKHLPTPFLTPYHLIDVPKYANHWQYSKGLNDRSYNFSFDTGNYRKSESSDSFGNIRGIFEYEDDAGYHDLSYFSNDTTGFVVTGGNLANSYNGPQPTTIHYPQELQKLSKFLNDFLDKLYSLPYGRGLKNHSYYFKFESDKHKIEETSNRNGNITGDFEYRDDHGLRHDLSYEIDELNGFRVIGGSLADNHDGIDSSTDTSEAKDDGEIVFLFGKTTMNPFITAE